MRNQRLLLLLIAFFKCQQYFATTTSIATRQVNVSDGIVITGALNGTNNAQWENDEKFQGFSGIVDWFLTWDDNNLYVGKIGGNNAQGSMIYLRADWAGAQFSNSTQLYDGFAPNLSLMNGINFVAYFKNGYNEFRTFNGGWSAASNGLSPAFSNQNGSEHFEMAIPWNVVTNGNGKPTNVRAVFYQSDNASGICTAQSPNPFLYAESPWGTGVASNGPNVGVNDGTPTSAPQPGGCGNGGATITRWWGCYPVIGGVGANGFVATSPNAGNDKVICSSQSTVALQANEPAADAVGTWSLVSAPIGANPQFLNVNDKNTTVSNLNVAGEYILVWNINYGLCPAIPDTMKITVWQAPSIANAGVNQLLNCGVSSATMAATAIASASNFSGGIGTWTALGNNSIISDIHAENTLISGLNFGENKFAWTTENAGCAPTSDTIVISNFAPVSATLLSQQNVCGNVAQIAANNPAIIQNTATGLWTQTAGNANIVFNTPHLFSTQITNVQPGTYALQWKISNGNCPPDSVTMQLNAYPLIDAGNGTTLQFCNQPTVQLQGANPANIHSSVVGIWSVVSGSGSTFSNNQNFTTTANGLDTGVYIFKWKLSNGICPADSAIYTVTNFAQPIANAGNIDSTCINSVALLANDPSHYQSSATGVWSFVVGSGSIVNSNNYNTTAANLATGNYTLQWKITNGVCPADSANVSFVVLPTIDAGNGAVQQLCNQTAVQLQGVNPASISASVVGFWSVISGNGSNFSNNQNFITTASGLDTGVYIFKWKLSNGVCPADSAIYTITNFAQPIANAGVDTIICGNNIQLYANNASQIQSSAFGVWSVSSGGAINIGNVQAYNTSVTNISNGTYILNWIVNNGVCAADTDDVKIVAGNLVTANAGATVNVCNSNTAALNATNVAGANGLWSVVDGQLAVAIVNANSNATNVTGLGFGATKFRWKITGTCNIDSADVVVNNYKMPISNAGSDVLICTTLVQLAANNPLSISSAASGFWQVIDGGSNIQFSNSSSNTATLNNLVSGNYTLQWSVNNGVCPTATSRLKLVVGNAISFGRLQTTTSDFDKYQGLITLTRPLTGYAPFRYSINNSALFNDTIIDSLAVGKYYLVIQDKAGCKADTIVEIKPNLFIPTGISPNGDGVNDTWQILNIEKFPNASIKIYSVWGETIFETLGNEKIFDGTLNDKKIPDGDYYFVVDLYNNANAIKGKLTILR